VVSTEAAIVTRRRSGAPIEDDALRDELRTDEKERSENLMNVDLMRNDLARICEIGTVKVDKLFDVDLLHALFPAGSMTGAPKTMAVKLLNEIESGTRGLYSGTFGFVGFDGTVQLSMTIRSIVISRGLATIGTGGGITAMSVSTFEIEETRLKVAASLAALRTSPSSRPNGIAPDQSREQLATCTSATGCASNHGPS
jgi:para-aminobenzoate synthetase component 1